MQPPDFGRSAPPQGQRSHAEHSPEGHRHPRFQGKPATLELKGLPWAPLLTQKCHSQPVFGALRDKLGVVTRSFFAQRDFDDKSILVDLFNSFEAAAAAAAASSAARDQLSAERQRKDKGKGKGKAVELPGEGVLDPSAAAEGAESAASSPAALRRAVNADGRHSSREGPVAGDTLERPGMGEEEGRPLDSPPLEEKARAAEENGEMYMGVWASYGSIPTGNGVLRLLPCGGQAPRCGNSCTGSGSRRSCSSSSSCCNGGCARTNSLSLRVPGRG